MSHDDIQFMNNDIPRGEQGFYEIPFPFKTEIQILPNNKCITEKRLYQLKQRLGKSKVFYDDYK